MTLYIIYSAVSILWCSVWIWQSILPEWKRNSADSATVRNLINWGHFKGITTPSVKRSVKRSVKWQRQRQRQQQGPIGTHLPLHLILQIDPRPIKWCLTLDARCGYSLKILFVTCVLVALIQKVTGSNNRFDKKICHSIWGKFNWIGSEPICQSPSVNTTRPLLHEVLNWSIWNLNYIEVCGEPLATDKKKFS